MQLVQDMKMDTFLRYHLDCNSPYGACVDVACASELRVGG
jgi:hypothetical protein